MHILTCVNRLCSDTQSGRTVCFSSCNVVRHIACVHENVFGDVVSQSFKSQRLFFAFQMEDSSLYQRLEEFMIDDRKEKL